MISVQTISHSPMSLSYSTPSTVSETINNLFFDVLLNVKNNNGNGSDRTVNISAVTTCDMGDYNNISEIISDGNELIIPLHSRITSLSSKNVTVRFSPTISGITCAAFRILK